MHCRVSESGRALTLLEVAAVLFLVSASALVAVPFWESDRLRLSEAAAVQILRRISAAQTERIAGDPSRGFAFLDELMDAPYGGGPDLPRGRLDLPSSDSGVIQRGGYCFVVFLCDATGRTASHPSGWPDFQRDLSFWVAYAWPRQHGVTGRDLYAISHLGRLYSADNPVPPWSGPARPPPAALLAEALGRTPLPPFEGMVRLRWREVPAGAAH